MINKIISLIEKHHNNSDNWISEVSKEIKKIHDKEIGYIEEDFYNLKDEISDLESEIENLENEISSMNYRHSILGKLTPSNLLEEQKVEILSTFIDLSLGDLEKIQKDKIRD